MTCTSVYCTGEGHDVGAVRGIAEFKMLLTVYTKYILTIVPFTIRNMSLTEKEAKWVLIGNAKYVFSGKAK
mgnify:CR=1 FL=1